MSERRPDIFIIDDPLCPTDEEVKTRMLEIHEIAVTDKDPEGRFGEIIALSPLSLEEQVIADRLVDPTPLPHEIAAANELLSTPTPEELVALTEDLKQGYDPEFYWDADPKKIAKAAKALGIRTVTVDGKAVSETEQEVDTFPVSDEILDSPPEIESSEYSWIDAALNNPFVRTEYNAERIRLDAAEDGERLSFPISVSHEFGRFNCAGEWREPINLETTNERFSWRSAAPLTIIFLGGAVLAWLLQ